MLVTIRIVNQLHYSHENVVLIYLATNYAIINICLHLKLHVAQINIISVLLSTVNASKVMTIHQNRILLLQVLVFKQ